MEKEVLSCLSLQLFCVLACGTVKIKIYVIGVVPTTIPSRLMVAGPAEPDSNKLFEVNSTFVVLHLDAWDDRGCPVAYFVVQYRAEGTRTEWTLYSNNVVPQQQLVHLGDLTPGSWYTLLMSAHNDAGSTEVELSFATLTLAGGVSASFNFRST